MDFAKKTGKQCLIFKVDFEKAYDSVNWNFLDYMMRRFGFCDKWKGWIKECIFSCICSVLVNGSLTEEIRIKRGLKQGDPLAPFLFLMVAEGLSGLVKSAVLKRKFKRFKVESGSSEISVFQYADDRVFVGEACWENI